MMHNQFKRAIGVSIARGNAMHKLLARLQLGYIRRTKESAIHTVFQKNATQQYKVRNLKV